MSELEDYIRQSAIKRGIDPNIALRVARSEGLAPGVWQSNVKKNGVREPSYGPFQLLVGGTNGFPRGMGNDFVNATGLDPSDPSTANAQVDFALDQATKRGWSPWYGAKKAGVNQWDGLRGAQPKGLTLTTSPTERLRTAANAQDPVTVKSGELAPALPAPVDVDPAVNPVNTAAADPTIGDKIGKAVYGEDLAAKLKAAFAPGDATTKPGPGAGLMGLLSKAMNPGADAQAEEHAQPIQSIIPSVDNDIAQRMQGAQQLMATILANRKKTQGLTLTS